MLGSVVAQIVALQLPQHHPVRAEQPCRLHLSLHGPTRRTIGLDVLGFGRAPDRHADGDRDRNEAAGCGDVGTLHKDGRRIGVVEIPPPEEGRRIVDRPTDQLEPWLAQLKLEAELPRRPLCRAPSRQQHYQGDDSDLAPENFSRGHGRCSFLVSDYRPRSRLRPRLHSMPPLFRATPAMCWPSLRSISRAQGTSWKPSPLSIMAKRPEESVRRWR